MSSQNRDKSIPVSRVNSSELTVKQTPEDAVRDRDSPIGGETNTTGSKPLLDVQVITHELIGTATGQLKLTFNDELSRVKIKFEVDNPDVKVDRDDDAGNEGVFELDFARDRREQIFNVWATVVETERYESIYLSCFDERGSVLVPRKRKGITFKPPRPELKPAPPSHWIVDLFRYIWFVSKKWYIRYPILGVTIIVVLGLLFRHQIEQRFEGPWKEIQIRYLGAPPNRLRSQGIDALKGTNDGRPDPATWDAPAEWKFETNPAAIIGIGGQVGIIKPPELTALYDYKVLLEIAVTSEEQQSVSWLLRVQPNKQDYYLFTLKFPTAQANEAFLQGYVYENGKELRPLSVSISDPLEYYKFHRGYVLWINIEVKDNTFTHSLYITNVFHPDPNLRYRGRPKADRIFTDSNPARYPWGSFGFKNADQCELKVVALNIFEIN